MVGAVRVFVVSRTKRRKMAWWTGGVDQGPWLQERVGGGVGAGWQLPKKGEGWGLVGCSKKGQVQGRVGLRQFHRRGQGLGGESKGFGSGRVGVLFFESWRVDLVTCSRCGARALGGSKGFGSGGG